MVSVPCAVAEIDLVDRERLWDLPVADRYRSALVLVRASGIPIGVLNLPAGSGWVPYYAIAREIRTRLFDRVVRAIIEDSLAAPRSSRPRPRPSVATIVCTRDRPEDLRVCLTTLVASDLPDLDILVVDNAPADSDTPRVVASFGGRVRYASERTAGLSRARQCGIASTDAEVVAFVDDDVTVDRRWASTLADSFAADPTVMAVLGLVMPRELETTAQSWFEDHGGFGRGFERRWIQRSAQEPAVPALVNTGTFGTGANMAFRREVLESVGGFDPALGAGTPSGGGEDLDLIFRVVSAGHAILYEPSALVWHRHRRDVSELRDQIGSWGSGMAAYLAKHVATNPRERASVLALATRLLLIYYPRRVLQSLVRPELHWQLTAAELAGALRGPFRYLRGRRVSGPMIAGSPLQPRTTESAHLKAVIEVVELDRPLPEIIPNPGGREVIELSVISSGGRLEHLSIATGGRDVGWRRLAHEIAASMPFDVLDPDRRVRNHVQAALDVRT